MLALFLALVCTSPEITGGDHLVLVTTFTNGTSHRTEWVVSDDGKVVTSPDMSYPVYLEASVHEWYLNGELVKRCYLRLPFFADGFETGFTGQWSATVGGE